MKIFKKKFKLKKFFKYKKRFLNFVNKKKFLKSNNKLKFLNSRLKYKIIKKIKFKFFKFKNKKKNFKNFYKKKNLNILIRHNKKIIFFFYFILEKKIKNPYLLFSNYLKFKILKKLRFKSLQPFYYKILKHSLLKIFLNFNLNLKKIIKKNFLRKKNILYQKVLIKSSLYNFKYNSLSFNLYNKFLCCLFNVGKKFIWHKKLLNLFNLLSLKLGYTKSIILIKIFSRLYSKVEVREIHSRKRTTLIPFSIKFSRSIFLALKWIFAGAKKKKGHFSFQLKLFQEIFQLLTSNTSYSIKQFYENAQSAYKNRSNLHYRW